MTLSKKDLLYLLSIVDDNKGIEILNRLLYQLTIRNKKTAKRIAEKRKQNKLYARSKKEIQAYEKAQMKKGGR